MQDTIDLKGSFDTASDLYEKLRPGYVDELYQKLFSWIPLGPVSKAVEVGPGAGQATLPILRTGCQVTAVEYGTHTVSLSFGTMSRLPIRSVGKPLLWINV